MQSHPFTSAEAARTFVLGGNATVTLRSKATDTRFTYKIQAPHNPGNEGTNAARNVNSDFRFVKVLTGADNETSYSYLGYIRRGVFFHGGSKTRVGWDAPSHKAFAWGWKALARDILPDAMEVWHEGRCGRCNRKLTVPSSIASGMGPECAERTGVAALSRDFRAEAV